MEISFERLLGEIAEGITVTDPRQPDNPLVYVNPAFCRLTGYSAAEVLGRNCRFLQGPDTDQPELDRLRAAISSGQPCIVELLNYRKDGTRFWNNLSISPVFNSAGEIIYFTGIQLDVTRRRRLEDKQREFVGNLAHELKTPLAALMGLTDTMERQPEMQQETRLSILASLQSQITRLNETVESILNLSRIDYAGLSSARQLLDFRDVIQESIDSVSDFAGTQGVELEYRQPDQSVSILGDPWALSMLVGNLASNAIKYSTAGTTVAVELSAQSHTCRLSVADSGPGIASDQLELVFERFYRIDKSRSRANGGTGLGLAIVSEVARQHRGYVTVTSEIGEGSCFTVTLPLYCGDAA